MSNNSNFKNSLLYIINKMSVRDRIIWVLQSVFPVAILILAILGLNDILPIHITNTIDLVLISLLFIICGVKFFPERKVYSIIYFVLAVLMCGILIASFFI